MSRTMAMKFVLPPAPELESDSSMGISRPSLWSAASSALEPIRWRSRVARKRCSPVRCAAWKRSGMRIVSGLWSASSAVYPKSRCAAGLKPVMTPSASAETIASAAVSMSASSCLLVVGSAAPGRVRCPFRVLSSVAGGAISWARFAPVRALLQERPRIEPGGVPDFLLEPFRIQQYLDLEQAEPVFERAIDLFPQRPDLRLPYPLNSSRPVACYWRPGRGQPTHRGHGSVDDGTRSHAAITDPDADPQLGMDVDGSDLESGSAKLPPELAGEPHSLRRPLEVLAQQEEATAAARDRGVRKQ